MTNMMRHRMVIWGSPILLILSAVSFRAERPKPLPTDEINPGCAAALALTDQKPTEATKQDQAKL